MQKIFQKTQLKVCGAIDKEELLSTVAGDEGEGIALVQQAHNVFHVLRALAELPGRRLNDIHRNSFRCMV